MKELESIRMARIGEGAWKGIGNRTEPVFIYVFSILSAMDFCVNFDL